MSCLVTFPYTKPWRQEMFRPTPNGSTVVVLFDASLETVATGFHEKRKVRVFFGGKIEDDDVPGTSDDTDIARKGGLRELNLKSGIREGDLECMYLAIKYQWDWYSLDTKERIPTSQYVFIAVGRPGLEFPKVQTRNSMSEKRFVEVHDVLASGQFPQGDKRRTNPRQVIALFECLEIMYAKVKDDPRFQSFIRMYEDLPRRHGIYPDRLVKEILQSLRR